MPTILIVEDEDTVREVVSKGLQSEGYEVLVANNGLDGLRQAREADRKSTRLNSSHALISYAVFCLKKKKKKIREK